MTKQEDNEIETISGRMAERMCGLSARQLGRMAAEGELTRSADGKYLRHQIEALAGDEEDRRADRASDRDTSAKIVTSLEATNSRLLEMLEKIFALVAKPMEIATSAANTTNARLMDRLDKSEAERTEFMKVIGDILLHRDERTARLEESSDKRKMLAGVTDMLKDSVPVLISQLGGKAANAMAFLGSLTPEQLEGFEQFADAFEGEQRGYYMLLLKELRKTAEERAAKAPKPAAPEPVEEPVPESPAEPDPEPNAPQEAPIVVEAEPIVEAPKATKARARKKASNKRAPRAREARA